MMKTGSGDLKDRGDLEPYQLAMIQHVIDNPACALWVPMGMGKTVSTLTALKDLRDTFETHKTLIVAPKRVARSVWTDEVDEWAHLKGLKCMRIQGTPQQRLAALQKEADIYTIGCDNLDWLAQQFRVQMAARKIVCSHDWPFDTVVLDEARKFQSHKSRMTKAMAFVRPRVKRVIQLTGTPATNGLEGLWAQLYLLDRGKRLLTNITQYRNRYFIRKAYNQYAYEIRPDAEEEIFAKVADICFTLREEDYMGLPSYVSREVKLRMPAKELALYRQFKRDFVLELKGKELTAANTGALWGKLLQLGNGVCYTQHPEWVQLHDIKIRALKDLLENEETDKALIIYNFKPDLERLKTLLDGLQAKDKLNNRYRVLKDKDDEDEWNRGRLRFLLLHSKSGGHGLNLHKSGATTTIHFGLNPDLDLYQQVNARLFGGHRGRGLKGVIMHLVMEDTQDIDVMQMLKDKKATQERLFEATKRLIGSY